MPVAMVSVGVIVNITLCCVLVLLLSVPLMLPVPLVRPETFTSWSLVQLYAILGKLPVKVIVVMALPEQLLCVEGEAVAVGIGLTVTVITFE